jgi:hypothetical protein
MGSCLQPVAGGRGCGAGRPHEMIWTTETAAPEPSLQPYSRPRRQLFLGFASLAALGQLGAAAPAATGVHYLAVTRTSISGAEDTPPHTGQVQVEGWALGPRARIEVRESANPAARAGTYLLSPDAGRKVYLVDPKARTYTPWNLDAMLELVGGVLHGMGPLLQLHFSDPKVEQLPEGDGGNVAGLPTRLHRFRISYTTEVNVLGMSTSGSTVIEQQLWITDKLRDAGLGVWLRSEPPRTGSEQLDGLIAARTGGVPGYPLRAVTVSTSRQRNATPAVTRTTMEVTRLDAAVPPESAFALPPDFQEKQLLPGTEGVKSQGGR